MGDVLQGQNSIIEDNESAGDKNKMMVLFARRRQMECSMCKKSTYNIYDATYLTANSGSKTRTGVSRTQL